MMVFGAEEILKGDALHVSQVVDERGQVDALVLIFPELHADAVVGDGTNDDIVVSLAEVLVRLRLRKVYLTEVCIGTVVEDHISAPPFLWQYSAISATIDWKDCVWQ